MAFANIRIARKLTLGFAVVVGAVLAMGGGIFFATVELVRAEHANADAVRLLAAINLVQADIFDQAATVRAFVISPNPQLADDEARKHEKFDRDLQDARALAAARSELLPLLEALKQSHDGWQREVADPQMKLAADPATKDKAMAMANSAIAKVRDKDFRGKTFVATKSIGQWSSAEQAASDRTVRIIWAVVAAGSGLAAVLAAAMGWLLARGIARPVKALAAVMTTLAAGDRAVAVPALGRKDEVGVMARAVQSFKDAAVEKALLEERAAEAGLRAEAERLGNERLRQAAAERQAAVVAQIGTGLARLSDGDLAFQLEDPFEAGYEKLRLDFNAALGSLREVVAVVGDNSSALRAGAGEISTAAGDLSRRTEQQAASLEETAAALDEITVTVNKTAESAARARSVVTAARDEAQSSGETVGQAVAAMAAIADSSRQISQIIGVIDEIAFQTNLLALNAGVEAARAGDAGRGFAVVAAEVRALAQRSATSAKEIKALVQGSAGRVKDGVGLVGRAGQALERIKTQIVDISDLVREIAASAQEQATGLQQINTAVNQMDQMTQQNAAMVEQSTAASHKLADDSGELATLIGRFQVGEARPSGTVVALRVVDRRGGAAQKPDRDGQPAEWDAF